MRRRFSRDQWRAWLVEHESSGMSVAAFCQQIGVHQNSFYLWRRKLNGDGSANGRGGQPELVAVEVVPSETIRFQLPGGVITELPNRVESIQPLLQVLTGQDADQ